MSREFGTYSKLYYTIAGLVLSKKSELPDFIKTNQDKIIDDDDCISIFEWLLDYSMPSSTSDDTLVTFRESARYKILEIIFLDKFDFCVNLPIILVKMARQNHSDVILDLFLQNRSRITDEMVRYVHMLGTYDMVKLIIEKYKKEPTTEQIKNIIYGYKNNRFIQCAVQKYYVKTYLGTINDTKFLSKAWYNYYSKPNVTCKESKESKESKEIFMYNLLHRDSLRQIVLSDSWKTWDCYAKYMKRIVLTILKRHRINSTPIGIWNDVGQLYRIIKNYL